MKKKNNKKQEYIADYLASVLSLVLWVLESQRVSTFIPVRFSARDVWRERYRRFGLQPISYGTPTWCLFAFDAQQARLLATSECFDSSRYTISSSLFPQLARTFFPSFFLPFLLIRSKDATAIYTYEMQESEAGMTNVFKRSCTTE